MKTVALISGGKDSCFNMMLCVAEGHQIVALANLRPQDKDELDSYMYQTVGHQAIDLYAEAMDLPLYRHTITGSALDTGSDYLPTEADEVEDLFQLLARIKKEMDIEAVAVGAILSNYQRVRVENVCLRLGLTPLAYLWQREQAPLMQEMISCGVEAIVIKVAALGLEPGEHLGRSLQQIQSHMMIMQDKYGLNVCGEGGEYETFTLDCPLFHKKIVVDEKEMVIHSDDAFACVGYLNFKKLHLEDKGDHRPVKARLRALPLTTSGKMVASLISEVGGYYEDDDNDYKSTPLTIPNLPSTFRPLTGDVAAFSKATSNFFSVGPVVAVIQGDLDTTCHNAMDQLKGVIESLGRKMTDVFSMSLYVSNMSDFASINAVYKMYFGINPPVRICVGACLPDNVLFAMDCQGFRAKKDADSGDRRTMHVQGISHWAPANIGPYSQATMVDKQVHIAGQIALVPGTMQLVSGKCSLQCRLALQHACSVFKAMCPGRCWSNVLLCVCYVTHPGVIPIAQRQWKEFSREHEEEDICVQSDPGACIRPIVEYVVVPSLPRGACVEWQVYGHSKDIKIKPIQSTRADRLFQTTCLYSDEETTVFTCTTHAYFFAEDQKAEMDIEKMIAASLKTFSVMFESHQKTWSDIPLLRLFFPAHVWSYNDVLRAWTKVMEALSCTIPVSLVPVVQLGDRRKALVILCH